RTSSRTKKIMTRMAKRPLLTTGILTLPTGGEGYNGEQPRNRYNPMKSLCVYCGSRPGADPDYAAAAAFVGREAARRNYRIVYGGGKMGLMGVTAGAARDAGGKVFGVIPDFLVEI